jgi:SAM-dependent methyltransferase
VPVGKPRPGQSTATPANVSYRVGRIAPYLSGRWLDFGCADGGYVAALLRNGASTVVGVDVSECRIKNANARNIPNACFQVFNGARLDFEDSSFDGAFVNEVLEHVVDEQESLREIHRVLRPGGHLTLMSPNRWFPIEGHDVLIGKVTLGPAPLIPWLPEPLTRKWTKARNYWPHQLVGHVRDAGFTVQEVGFIWPVFEVYPWLPERVILSYRKWMPRLSNTPGLRRFGLSTLVVATKPHSYQ